MIRPFAPGDQIGSYRIDATLGAGGMGVVFQATQVVGLRRSVALKVIHPHLLANPDFAERFRSEALVAARVEHPNIVPVYEAGDADGVAFIVMRYIPGLDLAGRLRTGAQSRSDTANICGQIAAALTAAHRRGIIHRDVKPANVLIADAEDADQMMHCYLSDFGLARLIDEARATRTGQWLGTASYVAPEQIDASPDLDARADVYSLACVAYECLTGVVPFHYSNQFATLVAHARNERPKPSLKRDDIGPAVDEVIARGLAIDAFRPLPDRDRLRQRPGRRPRRPASGRPGPHHRCPGRGGGHAGPEGHHRGRRHPGGDRRGRPDDDAANDRGRGSRLSRHRRRLPARGCRSGCAPRRPRGAAAFRSRCWSGAARSDSSRRSWRHSRSPEAATTAAARPPPPPAARPQPPAAGTPSPRPTHRWPPGTCRR